VLRDRPAQLRLANAIAAASLLQRDRRAGGGRRIAGTQRLAQSRFLQFADDRRETVLAGTAARNACKSARAACTVSSQLNLSDAEPPFPTSRAYAAGLLWND
jgi:hypothetical protein